MDSPSAFDRIRPALSDRYRLDRELGQGGMATVFLAHDVRHQRKVAIKVLHPELSAVLGPERFLKEIELTASLQHPHILPLFDSGAADGLLYYVMPYVEGETLRARLTREHQLPLADALRIATEVADALEYAHKRGVVHRDIKPENILLHEGRPLVADFGIALAVQQAGGSRMTQTGMSLGTPQYMAPEQAMGERTIDHRADLYALGAVTYEMLTGEPPFTGPTTQAIVAKVLTDQPRPPSELRRSVPPAVEAAVLIALDKLPADRWSSAAEFAAALSASEPQRLRTSAGPRRVIPAGRDRTRWIPAAFAATTLLALAWAIWEAVKPRPVPPAPVVRFTIPGALGRAFSGNLIAISPDGTKLVFVQDNPSMLRTRLMLRRLDAVETVPIPGTEGALAPFFSPDGERIAFSDGSRVRKTRIEGGGGVSPVTQLPGSATGRGTWGPNDMLVLAGRGGRLFRVPASGGNPEPIAPQDSTTYRDPSWLPDGEHLLVSHSIDVGDAAWEILVVSARDGKTVARLGQGTMPQYVAPGYLTWLSPEGSLMAARFDAAAHRLLGQPFSIAEGFSFLARSSPLAVAANGTFAYSASGWSDKELVLVSPGGVARALPPGTRAFRGPRFSPDGSRIAVDVEPGGDLVGDIWLYDVAPQTFTRLTFEGTSVFPEWAPNGRDVLYSAATAEGRGIFRVPADRSASPVMLTSSQSNIFEGLLTPDEKQLLYRENSGSTGRDILLLVGKTLSRWAGSPFNERSVALTRDGRLVAYVSDESGRDEVYLKPLAGGGSIPVSSQGGSEPRWGPGDRELFFRLQDSVFAVPVTRAPALRVGARRLVLVGDYVSEPYHANYDVAPDGSSFVFIRQVGGTSLADVIVVLNRLASPPARNP